MSEKPDDVPSLEELGEGDDVPAYWEESTTITVDRWVKESLDAHREGRPWNQYLEQLRREHADPITFNDAQQIVEYIDSEVSLREGIDPEEIAHEVARQLDYVALADQVAGELEGRMR